MFSSNFQREFFLESKDGRAKRAILFLVAIAIWWMSEQFLRPVLGDSIQEIRNYFGNGVFVRHVLSQSLPVDIVCFLMLVTFCAAGVIPKPQFGGSLSKVVKEGSVWGILICMPAIPLALYLGFKLGFAPNWQSILGNIVSNSYEELTYRVFLFSIAAYAFRNIWVGILVSAVLFAWIHNQYPVSMQIVVGLASMFFSFAYIRSRNVLAALWAHQLSDMILDSILL